MCLLFPAFRFRGMVLLFSQAERFFHFFSYLSAAATLWSKEGLFKKALQTAQQNALGQQCMSRLHFKKKKMLSVNSREPTTWISLLLGHPQWLHRIRRRCLSAALCQFWAEALFFFFGLQPEDSLPKKGNSDLCRCSSLSRSKTVVRVPKTNLTMLFFATNLCCLFFPPSSKLTFVAVPFCLFPDSQPSTSVLQYLLKLKLSLHRLWYSHL